MELAKRVKNLPPYLFVQISRAIAEKKAQGMDVISFGIGDPDIPTPNSVIKALKSASDNKINHRYPESEGLPVLRKNISEFYKKRFGVNLDPETQVINLIGAKEGIAHAALCFIDPGDIAISPDPAYPVYEIGTMFAGGKCHMVQLRQENGYLLDPTDIPTDVAKKGKILWLNYPNNPTGATASLEYFENLVRFCKEFDIALLHDACYTEVAYNGFKPVSFLQADGAKDVGIEFHSLSKTYNMTGWRLGWVAGNRETIVALSKVKSFMDTGQFLGVQAAGVAALESWEEWVPSNVATFKRRRDAAVRGLSEAGFDAALPKATMYVWVSVPGGESSQAFSTRALEQEGVIVMPGGALGAGGEGFFRIALTVTEERMLEATQRLGRLQRDSAC